MTHIGSPSKILTCEKSSKPRRTSLPRRPENPRLKGIQAYLREVSKLKFDETPNYPNLSNLLADFDCGFRFYLDECKKSFMKAASKLVSKNDT